MSGEKYPVKLVPVSDINEGVRIRQDLGDIESLAKNIDELGLLYPILVTHSHDLIDGGRRLAAVKLLGWTEVPVMTVELA